MVSKPAPGLSLVEGQDRACCPARGRILQQLSKSAPGVLALGAGGGSGVTTRLHLHFPTTCWRVHVSPVGNAGQLLASDGNLGRPLRPGGFGSKPPPSSAQDRQSSLLAVFQVGLPGSRIPVRDVRPEAGRGGAWQLVLFFICCLVWNEGQMAPEISRNAHLPPLPAGDQQRHMRRSAEVPCKQWL